MVAGEDVQEGSDLSEYLAALLVLLNKAKMEVSAGEWQAFLTALGIETEDAAGDATPAAVFQVLHLPVVDLDTEERADEDRRTLSGLRHVGADVAPTSALPAVATHEVIAVSYGSLRDGVGRDRVVAWLQEQIEDNWAGFDGLAIHSRDERTGRYDGRDWTVPSGLPVVRLIEGTSEEYTEIAVRAIQAINAALPPEWQLRMGDAVPLPATNPGSHTWVDIAAGDLVIQLASEWDWLDGVPRGLASAGSYSVLTAREYDADLDTYRSFIRGGLIVMDPEKIARYRPDELDRVQNQTGYLVHEIMHALGFPAHPEMVSILSHDRELTSLGGLPAHFLYPLDREGLLAAYTRLEPGDSAEDLGPWSDSSIHVRGETALPDGELAFGAAVRNGFVQPWAQGPAPDHDLADNPALTGSASWAGRLLGLTPDAEVVAGAAEMTIGLVTLDGTLDFTELESWTANRPPGAIGAGVMWGDGDLGYEISVRGNIFVQTGGDEGIVTGTFFGSSHEGMGGTLARGDLMAGFGGIR